MATFLVLGLPSVLCFTFLTAFYAVLSRARRRHRERDSHWCTGCHRQSSTLGGEGLA